MSEENAPAESEIPANDTPVDIAPGGETPDEGQEPVSVTLADAKVQSEEEEVPVPSYRLREESERRRLAEERESQLQQQNRLLTQVIEHNQAYPQQPGQPAQAVSPEEAALIASFGTPEEGGPQAYEAVKKVAESVVEPKMQALQNENARLRQELTQQVGGVVATSYISGELNKMKAQGLIDERVEGEISRRMADRIQQDPSWGQPVNQPHLLNEVYMSMLRKGEIAMARRPNPANATGNGTMPTQPGSGGGAETLTREQRLTAHDDVLRQIQQRYPNRLGGLSMEQMRELHPMHEGEAPVQPTKDGVPIEQAFVHRRS
jgi:hypothetical protein